MTSTARLKGPAMTTTKTSRGRKPAMPDRIDIIEAVRSAVAWAMPAAPLILQALRPDPPWMLLPPGSHVRLGDDDERGVDVIALRSWPSPHERGEVMTVRGAVLLLGDDCRLRLSTGTVDDLDGLAPS